MNTNPVNSTASLIMNEDIQYCLSQWSENDSPFWRRSVVRLLFSNFEAVLNEMLLEVHAKHEEGSISLNPGEIAMIHEVNYEVNDGGEIKLRSHYISFLHKVKFAFKLYANANGVDFTPDYSDHRWANLRQSVKIRDRITHPKAASDLTISNPEFRAMNHATLWFIDNHKEILVRVLVERNKIIKRLEREVKSLR